MLGISGWADRPRVDGDGSQPVGRPLQALHHQPVIADGDASSNDTAFRSSSMLDAAMMPLQSGHRYGGSCGGTAPVPGRFNPSAPAAPSHVPPGYALPDAAFGTSSTGTGLFDMASPRSTFPPLPPALAATTPSASLFTVDAWTPTEDELPTAGSGVLPLSMMHLSDAHGLATPAMRSYSLPLVAGGAGFDLLDGWFPQQQQQQHHHHHHSVTTFSPGGHSVQSGVSSYSPSTIATPVMDHHHHQLQQSSFPSSMLVSPSGLEATANGLQAGFCTDGGMDSGCGMVDHGPMDAPALFVAHQQRQLQDRQELIQQQQHQQQHQQQQQRNQYHHQLQQQQLQQQLLSSLAQGHLSAWPSLYSNPVGFNMPSHASMYLDPHASSAASSPSAVPFAAFAPPAQANSASNCLANGPLTASLGTSLGGALSLDTPLQDSLHDAAAPYDIFFLPNAPAAISPSSQMPLRASASVPAPHAAAMFAAMNGPNAAAAGTVAPTAAMAGAGAAGPATLPPVAPRGPFGSKSSNASGQEFLYAASHTAAVARATAAKVQPTVPFNSSGDAWEQTQPIHATSPATSAPHVSSVSSMDSATTMPAAFVPPASWPLAVPQPPWPAAADVQGAAAQAARQLYDRLGNGQRGAAGTSVTDEPAEPARPADGIEQKHDEDEQMLGQAEDGTGESRTGRPGDGATAAAAAAAASASPSFRPKTPLPHTAKAAAASTAAAEAAITTAGNVLPALKPPPLAVAEPAMVALQAPKPRRRRRRATAPVSAPANIAVSDEGASAPKRPTRASRKRKASQISAAVTTPAAPNEDGAAKSAAPPVLARPVPAAASPESQQMPWPPPRKPALAAPAPIAHEIPIATREKRPAIFVAMEPAMAKLASAYSTPLKPPEYYFFCPPRPLAPPVIAGGGAASKAKSGVAASDNTGFAVANAAGTPLTAHLVFDHSASDVFRANSTTGPMPGKAAHGAPSIPPSLLGPIPALTWPSQSRRASTVASMEKMAAAAAASATVAAVPAATTTPNTTASPAAAAPVAAEAAETVLSHAPSSRASSRASSRVLPRSHTQSPDATNVVTNLPVAPESATPAPAAQSDVSVASAAVPTPPPEAAPASLLRAIAPAPVLSSPAPTPAAPAAPSPATSEDAPRQDQPATVSAAAKVLRRRAEAAKARRAASPPSSLSHVVSPPSPPRIRRKAFLRRRPEDDDFASDSGADCRKDKEPILKRALPPVPASVSAANSAKVMAMGLSSTPPPTVAKVTPIPPPLMNTSRVARQVS